MNKNNDEKLGIHRLLFSSCNLWIPFLW